MNALAAVTPSAGVGTVLVNGQLAVDRGEPTGLTAGRALLRTPREGSCPA